MPLNPARRRSLGCLKSAALVAVAGMALHACSDPDADRIRKTTVPTYDKATGKLTQLTYDRDKNGTVDTWTDMDGTKPLRSRIDMNEDGKIDRWEYYDATGQMAKVGFSRKNDGKPDAWAFSGADGKVVKVEVSSASDEQKIDRWEHYDPAHASLEPDAAALVADEEDTNGDGKADKWETYENGTLKTVAFDENHDGAPDRRLTYANGMLASIESEPDGSGGFKKKVAIK